MERDLMSFPLPPLLKQKLYAAGFTTAQDVIELGPTDLSKEISISNEDALAILKVVRGETTKVTNTLKAAKSVHELLQSEESQCPITTFSQQLDTLLGGGGVQIAKITEICGAPGIGKTQLCIQLAVDVQIPSSFGGVQGQAVYIDTEGSFIVHRVVDIAKATVQHCQWAATTQNDSDLQQKASELKFEDFLSGIHYFRCLDSTQLLALGHTLPDFIDQHPQVKLVIVDSVAFHFRHGFDNFALRSRLLNGLAQQFIKLAVEQKLAVVLTNQMTTKIDQGQARLVPALGESWGHASTIRVILYWNNEERKALLYKSPTQREMIVPYQITMAGVRDVASGSHKGPNQTKRNLSDSGDTTSCVPPADSKRLKLADTP